jgi:hypothetical protein
VKQLIIIIPDLNTLKAQFLEPIIAQRENDTRKIETKNGGGGGETKRERERKETDQLEFL